MSTDPKFFDTTAYREVELPEYDEQHQRTGEKEVGYGSLVDATQNLANKGMVISFHRAAIKTPDAGIYFKAFITAFNETYNSDWSSESVYGRADPIYQFKQTQRKITLAYKVPCSTAGEAYENLGKVQQLIQFLYPAYQDPQNATTITQSPLVRLKVMNLLTNNKEGVGDPSGKSQKAIYDSYNFSGDSSSGLLGVINNLSVNHNIENPDIGVLEKGDRGDFHAILPKMIEINLDFSPIHETPLGWKTSTGKFSEANFPYGAPLLAHEGAGGTQGSDADFGWNQATASAPPGAAKIDANRDDDGWYQLITPEEQKEIDAAQEKEQNAANAAARYAGLLGDMRYRRDVKKGRGDDNAYIQSAMTGEQYNQSVTGRREGIGKNRTQVYDVPNPYDDKGD